ncbi:MAG: hypothetical protein WAV76_09600 [Bacteroidota bacterium]
MKSSIINASTSRGIFVLFILTLIAAMAMGQNVVIGTGASFAGSGTATYTIKGNITNTPAASFNGVTTLAGAAGQTIGAGSNALTFATLNANTTGGNATLAVSTTVSTALSVGNTSTLAVGVNTLTLGGTSTLNSSGVLDVSNASGTVIYNSGSAQSILGLTYAGTVTLSGAGAKDLAGAASVAGTFTHSGGALTVDQIFTVSSATPTFATIATVAAGKTLTLSGTGTKGITTVTTTTASGIITNTGTSGLLTIGTLSDNLGSIIGGTGGVTFTSPATNHGTITGGAGAVTFSNTLAQANGTITAGAGTAIFAGAVTQTGGSLASSASTNLLKFTQSFSNSGGGTVDLSATGAAEFDGTVTAGTINTVSGTTVTYGGSGQAIADMGYAGNLILTGGTKTWALGAARAIGGNLTLNSSSATTVSGAYNLNVAGNVVLGSNLTIAGAVAFANASSAVSNSGGQFDIVGTVTRTHIFAASTPYTYNNPSTTVSATATPANLTTFSLTVSPGTNPTGYSSGYSINRKVVQSYTSSGAFTVDIKLGYLNGEVGTAVESRLRDFGNGISKADLLSSVSANYTRVASVLNTNFGTVDLSSILSTSLTSGQELALDTRYYQFNSIVNNGSWATAATWDANAIPSSYDDVNIANNFAVNIPDGTSASALSVTIGNTTTGLTVGGGTSGSLAVGTGGLTNNNTVNGLTVSAGASVTITSGTLTTNGLITNNGTILVQ